MNIAKKLLLPLLLGGMVFATACGDDAGSVDEGKECTKDAKCKAGLLCVKGSDAAKGTCTKKCDEKNKCADGQECKAAAVVASTPSGKVCVAKAGNGGDGGGETKAAIGKACADDKPCVDTAECISKVCHKKCTAVGAASADCSDQGEMKECKEDSGKKFCAKPADA